MPSTQRGPGQPHGDANAAAWLLPLVQRFAEVVLNVGGSHAYRPLGVAEECHHRLANDGAEIFLQLPHPRFAGVAVDDTFQRCRIDAHVTAFP